MKTKNFLSAIAMIALMMSATTLFGQNKQPVSGMKGAYIVISGDGSSGYLEINGSKYKSYSKSSDEFFEIEGLDGKYGVYNGNTGVFVFPCTYYQVSTVGSSIMLTKNKGDTPKFYSKADPKQEVQPEKLDMSGIRNDNFTLKAADRKLFPAIEAMQAYINDKLQAFEIKNNLSGKQDLIVDGKTLFTADTYQLITNQKVWNDTKCWFFIVGKRVGNREVYGVWVLCIWMENGKKCIETRQTLPYDYEWIELNDKADFVVNCRPTGGGAMKYLTFMGSPLKDK